MIRSVISILYKNKFLKLVANNNKIYSHIKEKVEIHLVILNKSMKVFAQKI